MFEKRKLLSLLLVMILVVTLLTACQPEEATPDPNEGEEQQQEGPSIVPEEVLLDAAIEFMGTVSSKSYIIPGTDVMDLLGINPDALFVVDMRSAADYAEGHIEGAVNIPFAEIGGKLNVIPADKPVYFVCYSGQSSAQATAVANLVGLEAFSFRSGMNFGWSEDFVKETTENALPEPVEIELTEEEQVIWDAATTYFDDGVMIISPEDLLALVEDNPDMITILDIRREEDFAAGHVESAINIPFAEVSENFDSIPTNRPVYVICYTGQTAGITSASLRMAGYNAFSLNRGMTGWDGAELPKVTE
jgi:rhodanese-related sulfurtransferase